MRIFVYEWVTGGGMLACEGRLHDGLLTKGLTMARSIAEDFAALPGAEVTLLRDLRIPQLSAKGCQTQEVDSPGTHNEAFEQLCRESDAVLLIAPETDSILLKTVDTAEEYGAKLVSPSKEFVEATGNKHHAAERLTAAGVAAVEGMVIEADELLPPEFPYPAVLKPIDGAGSEDTFVVASSHEGQPYPWPRRLEPFVHGTPASVGVLCGPAGCTPLEPTRQRISTEGRLRYLGGSMPLAPGLVARAQELATKATAALPPAVGYIGFDLVLGANPDGSEDRVIEVNPRLTTSYAGLRFACEGNLAGTMLDAAAGELKPVRFKSRPIAFAADGVVSYADPTPTDRL